MSARGTMTMRLTAQRASSASDGAGGRTLTWTDHLTGVHCRAWDGKARVSGSGRASGVEVEGERVTIVNTRQIIVPLGTDITTSDRITSITDRQAREIYAGPMSVDLIAVRADHMEITSREVA